MPKRGVSHDDIAKRLGLARSTVTKILNQLPSNRASAATVKKVFDTARELGYNFHQLRNIHRRKSERMPVDMEVSVEILSKRGREVAAQGTATLCNISLDGALISKLALDDGAGLPVSPFVVVLECQSQPLAGVTALADIVRLTAKDELEMGLAFLEMSDESKSRLGAFLKA